MKTTVNALMSEANIVAHEIDGITVAAEAAHFLGLPLTECDLLVEAALRAAEGEPSAEFSMFRSGLVFGIAAERIRQREARNEAG